MSITVDWNSDAKAYLLVSFEAGWTWEQLFRALQQQEAQFRIVDGAVNVIMDCRNAGTLPDDTGRYRHSLAGTTGDLRGGITVLVGAGAIVRGVLEGVNYMRNFKTGKRTYIFARSMEEARGLLGARAMAS